MLQVENQALKQEVSKNPKARRATREGDLYMRYHKSERECPERNGPETKVGKIKKNVRQVFKTLE